MNIEPFFHTLTGFSPRQFQLQTIEKLLNRQDILLRAPTGSGKTETAIAPFLFAKPLQLNFPNKLIYVVPLRTLANSPTSFKQAQAIQPFPLPELVFSSLWRKWNAFASTELQLPEIQWQGFTAAYELKTVALKMKAGAEIGTKGWVRYQFPNSEQAQIATTLAHFAAFAGVGRKTAMGMGQTRIISRRSP